MVPAAIFITLGYRDHLFRHFVYFMNKTCLLVTALIFAI